MQRYMKPGRQIDQHSLRIGLISCFFAIHFVLVTGLAGASDPDRAPHNFRISEGGPGTTLHGGVWRPNKAVSDTIYLIGGPDRTDGKFQAGSSPNDQGWIGIDLTAPTDTLWNCDTYNSQNLDPETVPNHAYWCGQYFPDDCGTGDFGGYGNNEASLLDWRGTVPNPALSTTVTVTAVLNHDVEPSYDYLYFQNETADGMNTLLTYNGTDTGVQVNASFVATSADYVGPGGNEVHLRWLFESDGGWSDADCLFTSMGAAQIDLINVYFDQGGGPVLQSYEDCEGETSEWFNEFRAGVGDFSKVWPFLRDIDPCRENTTPQFAFVDDGLVVPGTGGYLCTTWCYGPGGYVVNPEGGLAGPEYHIQNEIWSPALSWPEGNHDGAIFEFNVWRHLLLNATSPGIFYVWHIRSVDTGDPIDLEGAQWRDNNFVFYGGPDYQRDRHNVTGFLEPGRTHVQLALGVYELGWVWGFVGTDASPSPYFDNVSLRVFEFGGPSMSAREVDLAQDSFPEIGSFDYGDPVANSIRFDMAQNISPASDMRLDPGDSLIVDVVPVRAGSILNDRPKLHYTMKANPLFDAVRSFPTEGWVYGDSTYNASGFPIINRWNFDLPDTGFFFPGDVIHYYFSAEDNLGGDIGLTLMPADTTGFSHFPGDPAYVPLQYGSSYVVRGLPSFSSLAESDHPRILFWNDFGNRGGEDEWVTSLQQLGYLEGVDYDLYYTNGPSSGVGNGLGSRATASQMVGYQTVLYSCGDLSALTMNNGEFDPYGWAGDSSGDLEMLDTWLRLGSKRMLLTGDNLVSDLYNSGATGSQFVSNWIGVNLVSSEIKPLIDNQTAPTVKAIGGNSVFQACTEWFALAGCPGLNEFDAVTPAGDTERLAEFTDPDCLTGSYDFAAATCAQATDFASNVIYLPYDLMSVGTGGCDPGKNNPASMSSRTCVLQEALLSFGHLGLSPAVPVPDAGGFSVRNWPNPFNPSTTIQFNLPQRGELNIAVYSVRGELVRTLLHEVRPEGPGAVVWDGTDDSGAVVAAGVYFYEARGTGAVQVGKMALIK